MMSSKRVESMASMVSTMTLLLSDPESSKGRTDVVAIGWAGASDERLSLVRLAASASSIGSTVQKRVLRVVVTAREDPESEVVSLLASSVTRLETDTGLVAVDGVVVSSSASHLSRLRVP